MLELRLGGRLLSPAVLVIDRHGELLLPLGELARAFELAIDVDPERGRAQGGIVHDERGFELDLPAQQLRIEGRPRGLGEGQIAVWAQDIYVDARTLSQWWPVTIEVSRDALRIDARSREPLPVERRLERERLQRRSGLQRGTGAAPSRGDRDRWWSEVSFDANLLSRVTRPELSGGQDWNNLYDLGFAGNLGEVHTELLASGVDTDALLLRARAGREDLEGGLGGSLRIREYSVGDVYTPALGQLSTTRTGRGFQISSFPLSHLDELGQLSIEGDLRPGYQVELYRGDVLLDSQSADDRLRYRFENVPTVPGSNELRLVFYGPRGERREEMRRYWSDGGLADAGESRFRVTVNQHDQDTLMLGDADDDDPLRGDPRAIGEFEHGLSDRLTFALGAASIPLLEGQHHYGTAALRTKLDGHLLRLEGFGSHEGGFAAGAGWQTRLGQQSLGLTHHEFRDFLSERTRQLGGKRLEARTEASLDGTVPLETLPFAYRVAAGHSRLTGGDIDFDGLLRLSTWLRPVFLTHTLRGHVDREFDVGQRTVFGDLLASFRRGPYGLRGRFLYSAVPGRLRAFALTGDWSPEDIATTRLGVTHQFGRRTAFFASLSRRFGLAVISADVSVDGDGLAAAGVGVSFGAVPDPFSGRPRLQDPGATGIAGSDAVLSDPGLALRAPTQLRSGRLLP